MALTTKAQGLQAQGRPIISLTAGEPDFDTPEFIREAADQAIREGRTRYTPAAGDPELRQAICEKLQRDNNLSYRPEETLVSNGAKHVLTNLMLVLCEAEDEVLILAPYWVSYPAMVGLAGAKPVIVPPRQGSWGPDMDALEQAVTPRTRMLILNSPNNPSGAVYSVEELKDLAAFAKRHGLFVIADDIYERLYFGPEEPTTPQGFAPGIVSVAPEIRDQAAVVNGCSKAFAMTGWRIGWAAAPQPVVAAATRLQSQSTSGANSIAQRAAIAALRADPQATTYMVDEFDRRRRLLMAGLERLAGITVNEPLGTFYAFPDVSALYGKPLVDGLVVNGSEQFAEALLDKVDLAVVPGSAFGDDRALRLSFATSEAKLQEALERLERFIGHQATDTP